MEKAQRNSNKSQSGPSVEGAHPTSEQDLSMSGPEYLSPDSSQTYTPRQMMHLQRTIGNQATLRMINRKTLGRIQRDTDDEGGNEGAQNANEQESEEQAQEDPEIAEQQAELDSIPPEAAQVEAEANTAKAVPVGVDIDDGDEDTGDNVLPEQDDMPVNEVPANNDSGPVDNNANSSTPAAPLVPMSAIKGGKKKKRNKQSGGNAAYNPKFMGTGSVANAVAQGVGSGAKAVDVGIDAQTAAHLIQEANVLNSIMPNSVETASDEKASGFLGNLEKVGDFMNTPPTNIILPVASLLQRVYAAYMKYKHFKAFKELAESGGGVNKEALKSKDPNVSVKGKVGTYGYLKTKRGLWTRATKAVLTFGQIVARVVTVASGLTASLASEGADLAFALAAGVLKLSESIKGLVKIMKGTRGKMRAKAANQIVDSALGGDQDMLKFMVDSEALSKSWFAKMTAANKGGILKGVASFLTGMGIDPSKISDLDLETLTHQPKNAQQMQDYLNLCLRLNLLKKVSAEVATVIKST